MPVATGSRLSKTFAGETIFQDVSFQVQERDRIAMVGANGAGKSTLLRMLAGVERPDQGTITLTSGARIGYLSQEVTFPPELTLRAYILRAFKRLLDIETQLEAIQTQLGEMQQGPALETLLHRHDALLHEYEHSGGYTYQNRMREVLAGLEIEEERLEQPLETFSGGQRTRAALAELLLSGQDLLLLDEPTNHLDLAAIEWLESYLTQATQAFVIVSHDRYFLDKVATRIWEMAYGSLEAYNGNYSQFAAQRAERQARQLKEYEAQQEYIARTEAFIDRYRAGQRSRQARGRQKLLDRLERVERPRDAGAMALTIRSTLRSGETVLATEGLVIAAATPPAPELRVQPGAPIVRRAAPGHTVAPEQVLFACPDLELLRGERAVIVGPNGAGKTTFLRVVTGEQEPAEGQVYIGHGVQLAYYAQAHEQLSPRSTVLNEILTTKPMSEEAARTYLGRFLFSGDDAFKAVSSLSGGERSRLALAKLALGNANFLVLDEPTNHLDIYSREALERVLEEFNGTILFVSHDRYLIDDLATQIWEVDDGQLTIHKLSWTEYQEQRDQARAAAEAARAKEKADAAASRPEAVQAQEARARAKEQAKLAARLEHLEGEIATRTADLHLLTAQLEAASAEADAGRIAELGRQHETTSDELAHLENAWLELKEQVESGRTLDAMPASSYRSA